MKGEEVESDEGEMPWMRHLIEQNRLLSYVKTGAGVGEGTCQITSRT